MSVITAGIKRNQPESEEGVVSLEECERFFQQSKFPKSKPTSSGSTNTKIYFAEKNGDKKITSVAALMDEMVPNWFYSVQDRDNVEISCCFCRKDDRTFCERNLQKMVNPTSVSKSFLVPLKVHVEDALTKMITHPRREIDAEFWKNVKGHLLKEFADDFATVFGTTTCDAAIEEMNANGISCVFSNVDSGDFDVVEVGDISSAFLGSFVMEPNVPQPEFYRKAYEKNFSACIVTSRDPLSIERKPIANSLVKLHVHATALIRDVMVQYCRLKFVSHIYAWYLEKQKEA
jgi:hypothetical protein